MNLVFIGSSKFGIRCLKACLKVPRLKVTGIVTSKKTFNISYTPDGVTNVLHANFEDIASLNNIPMCMMERSMNEPKLIDTVKNWKPDLFLVVGWYHMIPKYWRELAPAYALHASLLPDYSGGAPLVWAIINGENKTGITFFQMNDEVDAGPIAGQKEEIIKSDDTISTLYARIEERGLELLNELLPQLVGGTLKLRLQDESKRRLMPQRLPKDGFIDFSDDAEKIHRFIRAQTKPYPGAFTIFLGEHLHIWKTQITLEDNNKSKMIGQIKMTKDGIYTVTCGKGSLIIKEISFRNQTFTQSQLIKIFGKGEWRLGF